MKINARNKTWIKILSVVLVVVLVGGIILTDSLIKELKKIRKSNSDGSDLIASFVDTDDSTQYYEVQFALPDGITKEDSAEITLPETAMLQAGTLIYAIPDPEWPEHVFNGWYYDAEFKERAEGMDKIGKNMTLYPYFTPIQAYDDTFRKGT